MGGSGISCYGDLTGNEVEWIYGKCSEQEVEVQPLNQYTSREHMTEALIKFYFTKIYIHYGQGMSSLLPNPKRCMERLQTIEEMLHGKCELTWEVS